MTGKRIEELCTPRTSTSTSATIIIIIKADYYYYSAMLPHVIKKNMFSIDGRMIGWKCSPEYWKFSNFGWANEIGERGTRAKKTIERILTAVQEKKL